VHGYDVHIAGADGLHVAATRGGHEDLRHGVEVSRVEFGIHDGLWWAPDSRRVAFYREDFRPILPYPYVDHRPRPAVLVPGRYPMAGQNQSRVSIGVHTLASRETVWLATDPEAGEFLTNVAWTPDGEELWVVHVNRAQDREELWVYSAATGERRRRVLVEEDPRWQEPESPVHFVPGGLGSFLRFSWRTGFRHLDLHEASGERTRACTGGRFDLLAFSSFLPNGSGDFLVEGTGEDPRDRRLFRASLAGGLVDLTPEPGAHETELAPSSDWFLDRHTSLEIPLRVLARSAVDGSILAVLFEVEDPLSDFVAPRPEPFTTTTADGQPMHGFLLRPHGVAKGSRAPVIHYVYGGPKAQLVQNAWRGGKNRWNLWLAHLAARGYAVVLADGRGSAHRGIAWAQAVHRRLGDLEVEDQLRALDAALGLLPGDPDRVGVTGWSYGGYLSLCLATRGGSRYRAAAAGAPVTDWAFYETGYGERYMDRPEENPDGYRRARPAEHLDGLRARLLLVHGTADDTVVLQHSMDFLSACVRKGVLVDFLAYPSEKHAFRREALAHVLRLFTDHFDRNLPGP
jgi:dienelactone hydrolase